MKSYHFTYKCRHCGEEFRHAAIGGEESDYLAHMDLLNTKPFVSRTLHSTERNGIGLYAIHGCKDGSMGVSDLQGAIMKEEP